MKQESESGNVIIEFIGVVTALIIPLTVIATASVDVSKAYLGTEVAARAGSRSFVVSSSDSTARSHARSATKVAMEDHGVFDNSVLTSFICSDSPCLTPGGYVTVNVKKTVRLSLPANFGDRSITVQSSHTAVVDEIR